MYMSIRWPAVDDEDHPPRPLSDACSTPEPKQLHKPGGEEEKKEGEWWKRNDLPEKNIRSLAKAEILLPLAETVASGGNVASIKHQINPCIAQ